MLVILVSYIFMVKIQIRVGQKWSPHESPFTRNSSLIHKTDLNYHLTQSNELMFKRVNWIDWKFNVWLAETAKYEGRYFYKVCYFLVDTSCQKYLWCIYDEPNFIGPSHCVNSWVLDGLISEGEFVIKVGIRWGRYLYNSGWYK